MSDARAKLDLIYKDVLGDVTDLLDKVEALQNSLPAAATEVEAQLKEVLGQISESIGVLQGDKERLVQKAKAEVARVADVKADDLQKAVDAMLGQVGGAAKSAVLGVIVQAVNMPVGDAVKAIEKAALALNASTAALEQASAAVTTEVGRTTTAIGIATKEAVDGINEAKGRLNRPWWQPALVVFGAVVLGAVLSTLVGKWAGVFTTKAQITEMIESQRAIAAKLDGATITKAPRK